MVVERLDREIEREHPDPQGELRRRVAEAAGEEFTERDIRLERTREGFEAGVAPEAQRREITEDILEEAGEGFTEEDIVIEETDDGLQAFISPEAQRREIRERAAAESDLLEPSDITVQDVEDGFRAGFTEAAEDRLAAEQIRQIEESGLETPIPQEARSPVRSLELIQTGADRANLSELLRRSGAAVGLGEIDEDPGAIILGIDPGRVDPDFYPFTPEEIREAQTAILRAEQLKEDDPSAFIEEFGTQESLESMARLQANVAESFERGRQISRQERQFREEVGEDLGVRSDRIEVERAGDRFEVEGFFGEAEAALQQRIAEEEFGGEIAPEEIEVGVEAGELMAAPTRAGAEQLFQTQLEEAGVEVTPGEDFTVESGDDGFFIDPTMQLEDRIRDRRRRSITRDILEEAGEGFTEEDIVIEETDDGLQAFISPEAQRRKITEDILDEAGEGFAEEDVVVEETDEGIEATLSPESQRRELAKQLEEQVGRDISTDQDIEIVETDEGLTARLTEEAQREIAVEDIEQDIEEQFAIRRNVEAVFSGELPASAATGGALDLQLTDADVDIEDGQVVLTGTGEEKIDELQQLEAESQLGRRLSEQLGVQFMPGEDFETVETEEGTFEPKFTTEGRTKVATAPLTQTVEDVEDFLGVDFPGEGPIASGVGEERDLGHVGGEIGEDFEEFLADIQEDIFELTAAETVPDLEAERPHVRGPRMAARPRVSREEATTGQEFTVSAAEGVARTPSFVVGGVQLAKDVVDLEYKVRQDLDEGDFEEVKETGEDVGQAVVNTAAVGAATAIKNPVSTAGAVTGSLIGTGFLFAGARAVGPRTGFATRGLIQPGEEIAGIGGFRATKAIAGERRAQRFFPNQEPLIFSEEAAIRAAGRANRRAQQSLAATRERISRVEGLDIEPRAGAGLVPPRLRLRTEGETDLELDPEIQQALREAERGASIRRAEEAAQRRLREGEAERRLTPDDEPFVAERTQGGTPGLTQPGSIMRSTRAGARTQRSRLTSGAMERRRRAQASSVEAETEQAVREVEAEQEALGQSRRAETTIISEELLEQAQQQELEEATRLAVETEARQEIDPLGRVETGLDVETETRSDTETMQELRFDTEQELRQALELELETETETVESETELELEAETETEFETETEVEVEVETEFEQELEVEVEPPIDDERRGRREDDEDPLGLFTRTFEASVATPEEIVGSDIDAVDADIEADAMEAGRDLDRDLADIDGDLEEVFENDGI